LLMTLLLAFLFVGPLTTAGFLMADNAKQAYHQLSALLQEGLPDPPEWLDRIPVVGDNLVDYWTRISEDNSQLIVILKTWAGNSRPWLIQSGMNVGEVALELTLSLFIAFFFYRDGVWFLDRLRGAIMRITRDRTQHILDVVGNTVKGVIYGIVGTALAQSLVAGLGFWLAGVPMPFLLGLVTFFAALIPMGPPLVWLPAAIWLFMQDHMGWGIFMIIYGALGISGIDNILRPYLISYSAKMPFIIVFLGALGGAIGFGFLGIFLGPALLAVGFSLLKDWGNKTARITPPPPVKASEHSMPNPVDPPS